MQGSMYKPGNGDLDPGQVKEKLERKKRAMLIPPDLKTL